MKDSRIRLPREEVSVYSAKYTYELEASLEELIPTVLQQGFLTKEQLLTLGRWKSNRITHHLVKNSENLVQETTTLALATKSIRLAPQILMAMDGVGLPMASSILHWFHKDVYPILNFRALWSMGIEMPRVYSLGFWESYVIQWREVQTEWGCEKRDLDRALWQYSKEHQPQSPAT
jgi:hypothetical protein